MSAERIFDGCKKQGEHASRLFADWLSLPSRRLHGRDAHAPGGPASRLQFSEMIT
jgi:hypothetical protein